jgi:hypothetical protein
MDVSLFIHNSFWETVYKISANTLLLKGRHGLYHEIVKAAGQIQNRFGCYAWGTCDTLYYIGSYSKDYKRGDHKSNLHARIHNYLQNHRTKENGRKNTNLMVFENINQSLLTGDVSILLYKFDYLEFGDERIEYSKYCEDADMVRTVEQLLICSYRRSDQCRWNRD